MTESEKKTISFEKNIKENEIATNRLVTYVSILFLILGAICQFWTKSKLDETLAVGSNIFIPINIILLVMDILAIKSKFEPHWVKHMLMTGILLITAAAFFVYTFYGLCFIFVPVFLATRYYDIKLIRRVSLSSIFLFVLSCILHIKMDKIIPYFQRAHIVAAYNVWEYPVDVISFIVIPIVILGIFLTYYAVSLTNNGHHMIMRQTEDSMTIAKVEAELDLAAKIQQSVLPKNHFLTPDHHFELVGGEKSAKEVGGDFFDYFIINDHTLCFLIADVSDKGAPAALFMMSAKKAIFSAVQFSHSLEDAIEIINQLICQDNESGMFITLWLGIIDTRTGNGKYVNAGHCQPILKRANGSMSTIENDPDLFIGTFPDMTPKVHLFNMEKGDLLCLYTDGVTDGLNPSGEAFGMERLYHSVENAEGDAKNLFIQLQNEGKEFCQGIDQFDDITLVVVGCNEIERPLYERYALNAEIQNIQIIMNKVNDLLHIQGCPDDVRRDIDMMIDEICTNICSYAYTGETGTMEVDVTVSKNSIHLVFSDSGQPFNLLEMEDPIFGDEPQYGGLGIFLVKQKTDELNYQYQNGQNQVSLKRVWDI